MRATGITQSDDPLIESRRGEIFRVPSRMAPRLTEVPVQWGTGCFHG